MEPDDVGAVEADPRNAAVLAVLRQGTEPPTSAYRLGGFEQRVHPDVCERLAAVAKGGRGVGLYGHCVRVSPTGVIYAVGMGTSSIALRLPAPDARAEVMRNGGTDHPALGAPWVIADAWLSALRASEGAALLTSWVERAGMDADA